MIGEESREVERAKVAILRILEDSPGAIGSNIIARRLKEEYGIELSERAVRYHLRLLDERGLTQKVSRRDGRDITQQGVEELKNAMVADKVGFVIDKIELLSYRTSFDIDRRQGMVPINISMFPREKFKSALKAMAGAFKARLCVSDLVAVAEEGERLGEMLVPVGNTGLATVCSIVINGALLKEGIPMDSRFGGLLQLRDNEPWRFTELIEYAGSSLDPSEILIASRMTSIRDIIGSGNGKMLANFREVPVMSIPVVEEVMQKLGAAGIGGLTTMGEVGKPVCEVPVGLNKVGVVLTGGLNPVAAAVEAGINTANIAMGGLIDYKELKSFWDL
jgi:repressor of nif and glnA expression